MNDDNKKSPIAENISRRTFIEKSSLLAGGTILAGSLGACSSTGSTMAPAVFAGGSDTLKLAVVGCGGRGTGAAQQALKADAGVELVAVADAFADRANKCVSSLQRAFGGERIKVTPDTTFIGFGAFKQAIDMADVVILATPPGFRPEHFEYAVSQNKHIFMEKPVATDSYGVRRVLAAAREAEKKKLNVVVGLQRHYQPSYLETLKNYREGGVGEIVSGQVYWLSSGVWVRPREPGQTEMEYQMRNWYYFNWLCGDHILEQHIHNIDVANWFIGDHPISAQGMGGREVRKGPDHGQIFDHHFVEFTYASGAVISSQCRHIPNCVDRVEERFQTTGGSVYTDGSNNGKITNHSGEKVFGYSGMFDKSPYQIEHDELFASIRSGGVINTAENGANATMSAILGRMATYSGQEIKWDKGLASTKRMVPDSSKLDWDVNPPVMPERDGLYPVPVPGKYRPV